MRLNVPENSRNFSIAHLHVVDEENDNYTCSVETLNTSQDHQPFEIVDDILRTKSIINNTSKQKEIVFLRKRLSLSLFIRL